MLTNTSFLAYCRRLGFREETVALIAAIRAAPPTRTPRSGRSNVPVWYPSRKIGRVIKAESHTVEFAFLQEAEYSDDTLEFYDQPPSIQLEYRSKTGRFQRPWHTPDYFVLRQGGAGWEKCKPAPDLQRLALAQPHRYSLDDDGVWRCPPGERYAAAFGLTYRVRSSEQINWIAQSNWQYLEDYYRRLDQL
jgi:putative transposase